VIMMNGFISINVRSKHKGSGIICATDYILL